MSAKIGSLNVDLTMETARFKRGAKEAQTTAEKMKGEMRKVATAIGGAFAIPALGNVANEFREMGKEAIRSAQQVEQLAQVANAGVEEFQRVAYAAKSVGVENEKLADIYKDVNDKIGDFIATGGGGMADFFENIAPKVGVTADEFERLSGPQALQLYVSSLEKADLSQQQMTFYMEALASDATVLIPLLQDGGKAMGEFAAKADELGLVMSSEEIAKAKEVANNLGLLNAQIEAQTNKKLLENADSILYFERSLAELKLGLIDTAVTIDQKYRGVQQFFYDFGRSVEQNGRDTRAWAETVPAQLRAMKDNAIKAIRDMVNGVRDWVSDRLNSVWDSVTGRIEAIADKFKWLDDVVVRHSYIPDMVKSVAEWMGKLETDMVAKSGRAADKTAARFKALRDELAPLMRDLFPEAAALADRDRSFEVIQRGVDDKAISPEQGEEARRRANRKLSGFDPDYEVPIKALEDGEEPLVDIEKSLKKTQDAMEALRSKSQTATVQIAKSFKDMATETIASVQAMANAIKGGGFWNILQSVIGVGLQLGSAGVFGKGFAARLNAPATTSTPRTFPALSGARSEVLPEWNSGGGGIIKGHPGIDKNLLSLNGAPIARVSRGEMLDVRPANAAAQGGALRVEVVAHNDGFGAFIRNEAGKIVATSAPHLVQAASNSAIGTMVKWNKRSMTPGGQIG